MQLFALHMPAHALRRRRSRVAGVHVESGVIRCRLLGRALEGQRSGRIQEIRRSGAGDSSPNTAARSLARGGRFQIMEGPDKFQRFVVIEFPTFEQGVACFTSDEYNKAAAFRRSGAGEVEPSCSMG